MAKIKLFLKNKNNVLATSKAGQMVKMAYSTQYALGNYYELQVDHYPAYVWVQLDSSLRPALLYLTNNWTYRIPFNLTREWPYPTGAFIGRRHYAWARVATVKEVNSERNLALNAYDQHDLCNAYPHVVANAETDNNPVFYARNAVDGIEANDSHGSYPYESWGIAGRRDAALKLFFGRDVDVTSIKLVLRADYPHDTNWDSAKFSFSNGDSCQINLSHSGDRQDCGIQEKAVDWLKLSDLTFKAGNKGFTALTQIEVWGNPTEKG